MDDFLTGRQQRRRAVITGLGIIAANGKTVESFWETIRQGRSGCGPVTRFKVDHLPVKGAAEIRDFNLSDHADVAKAGRLEATVQYSLAAASSAIRDAGINTHDLDADRTAVVEGTTTSGAANVLHVYRSMMSGGKIHPYNAIGGYCGEGSSAVGMLLGINGHACTYCSGCASGNDAIGYGAQSVIDDHADVSIAGGSDAIFEAQHVGFCRLRAMSELKCSPEQAMRPFDRSRDGFVLGEGSAFFVIEELGHALSRGAHIYAEIAGHGRSCEAYHPTDPHPDGTGYKKVISRALRAAQMTPADIDYVNAHGSATPLNDPLESKAIKAVFGIHASRVGISATKPVTGHTMGASGAIETAICALAIDRGEMPPTINLTDPDDGCDLDYLPNVSRPYPIRAAMNINAGFGGRYACLILRKFPG